MREIKMKGYLTVTCENGHIYEVESLISLDGKYFWSSSIDFCKFCGDLIVWDKKNKIK